MKKITFLTLLFFFLLQYTFAETFMSSNEEDVLCKESSKENKSDESVISSSSLWTVCIAASTVALPMTRQILGANFSTESLFRSSTTHFEVQSVMYAPDFSSNKNIKSNDGFSPILFGMKVINDGIAMSVQADDFQIIRRSFLDFDFFKHRFSRQI